MFRILLGLFFVLSIGLNAQPIVYVVNNNSDIDDGVCDGVHCSLNEAIKASEADLRASRIDFNIPGPGPHIIVPGGTFPNMQADSTFINAPTAVGAEIVIDFGFRVFAGATFLQVNGNYNTIKGLHFTKMNYTNNNDHIIGIGTLVKNATENIIDSCNFYADVISGAGIDTRSIDIVRASNIKITHNSFGTDPLRTQIYQTNGSILVEATQDTNRFDVSNNVFVTKKDALFARGGNGFVSLNIFGAYDTTKSQNFLDPSYGVLLEGGSRYLVQDNFFIGHLVNGIFASDITALTEIKDNRFYNGILADIELTKNSIATFGIRNNFARNGKTFINSLMTGGYSLNIDDNSVKEYDNFYGNELDPGINLASYNRNVMLCISNQVTFLDNTKSAKPNSPTVISVNKNQIIGSADPNNFVAVYANPNTGCVKANTNCQGGFLLGISQANALGSWVLNVTYPLNHSISAYQYRFGTGYNIYSEFSPCYRCIAPVKIVNKFDLCSSGSFTYRGKNYGAANPYDSIPVPGDGVSICDSVFIVDLNIKNSTRETRNLNFCFNESIVIGGKTINRANPNDSLKLTSVIGCDSTIVLIGTERGLSTYTSTICSNASVTIGGTVFDKNNTQGIATIKNGSVYGCDSIIDVKLTIKNYAENNIVQTLCPNGFVVVRNQTFDINNPKGTDTIRMGSSTGCDSVINVNLSFTNPTSTQSFTLCDGDSVLIPNTNKFISFRRPLDTLILFGASYLKCDSFVYYSITTIPNSIGFLRKQICRTDTIREGGQIFHSGRTMGSFQIVNGATNGCDSTVQVELTVRQDAIGRLDTVSCAGSTIDIWGRTFSEFNSTGTVKRSGISAFGCDSFLMVNVIFIPKKTGVANPTICRNGTIKIGGTIYSANNPTGVETIPRPASQGCDSIVTVNVQIAPPIIAIYTPKDLMCNNPNTGTLTLNNVNASPGAITISIDNKSPVNYTTDLLFTGLSQGIHTIKVIDVNGCDTTLSFNINSSQVLSLQLPGDTTIFKGNLVPINSIINFVPTNITWDPPLYLSCTNCTSPISTPDEDITYMLTLEDSNGCIVKDNITIRVKVEEADIYMPNVFSPNGDQLNDIVTPEFRFPDRTKVKIFRIYDRWGALVYERLDGGIGEKFGWDGRFRERDLNPGVFTYAILYEARDQEAKWKFGDITLMR